jgi:hypothetical protein
MLQSLRKLAAGAALVAAIAMPVAVLAQGMPTLTLSAQAGFFTGKWVYRSFNVSGSPKDTLAKLALGLNELNLTEQKGQVAGQRTGQGVTYDLAGNAFYAAKQGATIRLHGTATISGKAYNYDYFGYVMPTWTGIGTTPDTIIGTVLRSDPANPSNAPLIASFSATRETAAAPAKK